MGNWLAWLYGGGGGGQETDRGGTKGHVTVEEGPVTLKELLELSKERGAIRVGAAKDPKIRSYGYNREGYVGTMYYAETENMKEAENKLLESKDHRHNVRRRSNVEEKRGYVYVIKGRKLN